MAQEFNSGYGPLPVFELHSGFWINLHHTLYYEAKQRGATSSSPQRGSPAPQLKLKTMKDSGTALTPAEQRTWDSAVAYYAANFANKDLLFNTDLMLLKNQLEDFEDCDDLSGARKKTCDAGLPGNVTPILDAAAPVYRAHLWADQDRVNRRWIARVAPLVEEQGVGVSQRLADVYQTKWPKQKIRVDVTGFANWAGAYTTLDPLRVTISSADSRNQDDEAFEVLFHEASHGIAEALQDAIVRECRQRGKAIPRDLWHALIFYTTGEVIKPVLTSAAEELQNQRGTGKPGAAGAPAPAREAYTPYAIREGLYQRGWNDYYQLLIRFWQPYLDSKSTFDDAIARMVSAL
jgi:GNAT superfamily N-acetyltransferase